MKIIQISDLHIPDECDHTHDIDSKQNLQRIISEIVLLDFDILVVTGDLAMKQSNSVSYEFIQDVFEQIHRPIYIIPGNHDTAEVVHLYFQNNYNRDVNYYSCVLFDHKFLFLNSSKSYIEQEQLEWIKNQLAQTNEIYIFTHHPILASEIPFMETKHSLQDRDVLRNVLVEYDKPVTIFCGHYHADKLNTYNNITQYICPSTFYQIDQDSNRFAIGSRKIGYRIIEITNHTIQTEVIWLEG